MKILLVNDCPIGEPGSGGVETHVQELQEALNEYHIDTAVLTHQYLDKPEIIEERRAFLHGLNAPPIRKRWLKNIEIRHEGLNKAAAFIHQFDPDVIHIHNLMNPATLHFLEECGPLVKSIHDCRPFCVKPYPVVASRLIGRSDEFCDLTLSARCWPRCYASAGTNTTERLEAWASFLTNLSALRHINRMPHLVLYSQYIKDLASRCVSESAQLHVIPLFSAAETASIHAVPGHQDLFTFLFAGRLSPEKGILHIFDALKRMPHIACRLVIAGTGPLYDAVRECSENTHYNHVVEMTGYLNREDMYKQYNEADVLLVPSYGSEGCSLSGIESSFFSTPAIGYHSGGMEEWLINGQTGIMVDRKDITGLARAMHMLATHREKARQLGRQAAAFVRQKFTRENHIRALLEIYQLASHTSRKQAS